MNKGGNVRENAFITRTKLTKKFFIELPESVYVVSNCYKKVGHNKIVPAFEESVESHEEREAQWGRIKSAHANHRLCFVYTSFEDYEKLKATWK